MSVLDLFTLDRRSSHPGVYWPDPTTRDLAGEPYLKEVPIQPGNLSRRWELRIVGLSNALGQAPATGPEVEELAAACHDRETLWGMAYLVAPVRTNLLLRMREVEEAFVRLPIAQIETALQETTLMKSGEGHLSCPRLSLPDHGPRIGHVIGYATASRGRLEAAAAALSHAGFTCPPFPHANAVNTARTYQWRAIVPIAEESWWIERWTSLEAHILMPPHPDVPPHLFVRPYS